MTLVRGGRTKRCFFSQEEGWPLPEKTLEGDHRCYKKALHPKHYVEVLATEGNSWRSSSR